MQRFLILGSTGMLGQALVRLLRSRGRDVLGVARRGADVNLDLTQPQQLTGRVEQLAPDAIINCAVCVDLGACEENPGYAYLLNTRLVGSLARACRQSKTWLVQISTDHYFSGDGPEKHDETARVNLCNEYATSKYLAEGLALTHDYALVVRTNIVGFCGRPGRPTFVEWAISALRNNARPTLFRDYFTSSIDVGSFSLAVFELLERKATGLLNVAAREVSSKKQFVEALAGQLALPLDGVHSGSVRQCSDLQRNESCGLDVSRAEALLGYALPGRVEVAANLARAYLENRSKENAVLH